MKRNYDNKNEDKGYKINSEQNSDGEILSPTPPNDTTSITTESASNESNKERRNRISLLDRRIEEKMRVKPVTTQRETSAEEVSRDEQTHTITRASQDAIASSGPRTTPSDASNPYARNRHQSIDRIKNREKRDHREEAPGVTPGAIAIDGSIGGDGNGQGRPGNIGTETVSDDDNHAPLSNARNSYARKRQQVIDRMENLEKRRHREEAPGVTPGAFAIAGPIGGDGNGQGRSRNVEMDTVLGNETIEDSATSRAVVSSAGGFDEQQHPAISDNLTDAAILPASPPSNTNTHSRNDSFTYEETDAVNTIGNDIPAEVITSDVQAYVAPTVYDAVSVRLVQTEREEKKEVEQEILRRYQKKAMIMVFIFVLLLTVILVPIFLSLKGTSEGPNTKPPQISETSMPTSAPSSIKFSSALNHIVDINLSKIGALSDKSSPQSKALHWVSNEDPNPHNLDVKSSQFIQRYVLAVFFYAMDGDNWGLCRHPLGCYGGDKSWFSEHSECEWKGINCTNNLIDKIILGRTYHNPHPLLKGDFPEEFCFFNGTKHIDLSNHEIQGTVPDCFEKFSELNQFLLANNRMKGEVPSFLFEISSLEHVNISSNQFNGSLPLSAEGKVDGLKVFDASDNSLTGKLPDAIYNAHSLEKLALQKNHFNGQLPSDFFMSRPNLTEVILSDNAFSGSIPENIALPSQLNTLVLEKNNFIGNVSQVICDAHRSVSFREGITVVGTLKILSVDCDDVTCSCCCGQI